MEKEMGSAATWPNDAMRLKTKVLRGLAKVCGAKNRRGLSCQCKLLLRGNKCKFHGGMSTGPKTPEGKMKAIAAMREGYKKWRHRRQ
jgi:hypothetical protein